MFRKFARRYLSGIDSLDSSRILHVEIVCQLFDREASAIRVELPHPMMKSSPHLAETAAGASQVQAFTELVNMVSVVGERSDHRSRGAADSQ